MDVLIAEDDPVSRRLLQAALVKWGYNVVIADDGAKAWALLQQENHPQVAILDWMMPEIDGVEVCRRLRQDPNAADRYVYVILLTARAAKEDIVTGMEAGADDYMVKPFHPHEMQVRIRAGRRIVELQSELVQARDQLRIQATHDTLTGLLNRGAILDRLEKEIQRSRRQESTLAAAMCDIDHFKQVNDDYGHQPGDAVLKEVARRLRDALRTYDAIGRYGGEEFLAIMPACDPAQAAALGERLRSCISETPMAVTDPPLAVTISVGVSQADELTKRDAADLIRQADDALYAAKRNGRNRVEMAPQGNLV